MSLGLEAEPVGLHSVDTLALGSSVLIDLSAGGVVSVDDIDASDTAALLRGDINVILDATTSKPSWLPN